MKIKPDEMSKAMHKRGGRDYVRELVRQRDGRKCQMCGKQWAEGMRRFDIHHIYLCGIKSRGYDKVSDMDGLITYCHKCHLNLDIVIKKMRYKTGNHKLPDSEKELLIKNSIF